ncbi:hypothetical protein D3C81_190860 [compost metagenome]
MAQVTTRDRDIITKSFRMLTRGIAPSQALDILDWDKYFNVFSSATGDNRYINPLPQWSPATDPRYGRLMVTPEGGMGPMWKEMYEDNVTLLTVTPGTAQFAGLLSFITNMFSPAAAIIANKGRAPGIAFYMGQAYGSTAFWPMQMLSISTQFLAFLMDSPRHNFWTVKPAMGAYTMAATGVLNDLMVKLGYVDPLLPKRSQEQNDPLHGLKPNYDNTKAVKDLSMIMPDVINADGTIDLMRLIMKGTRKHRVMLKRLAEMDNDATLGTPDQKLRRAQQILEEVTFDQTVMAGNPSQQYVEAEMNSVGKYRGEDEGNYIEQDSAYLSQTAYENITNVDQGLNGIGSATGQDGRSFNSVRQEAMQSMGTAGSYGTQPPPVNPNERPQRPSPATPANNPDANPNVNNGEQIYYEDNPNNRTWAGDVFDLVNTAISGGMDAITFRVEGTNGAVSDSFSNTSAASPMAEKFNSLVKSANDFRFDVAGGNVGVEIVDRLVSTIKEGAIGFLSGTVIGNIPLALAGNSYVKIANHWAESSSSLHKESYTINCRCNYAHPYEFITKIWVPFSLCLTLVAGFTAGGSTYTTPFYVKTFCKSRQIIRHGLVSSLNFTFGDGEAGWTRDRKPLNLSMTLNVEDLDPLVTVPIDRSLSILDLTNPAAVVSRVLSDDTAYNNYLTRLSGMDYLDTVLKYARLNRQLTQVALDMKTSVRADNIAAKVNDSIIGDLGRLFIRPLAR